MPRRERSLAGVVRAAEEVLRRHRVPHVFVGAVAVIVFGEVRTTRDVDVLAKLKPAGIPALVADFRRRGFLATEEDLRLALSEGGHSRVEDTRSPLRIDLALADTSSAEHALRHSVRVRWKGISFPVAAPEHTIVMKLKFGSDQDIEDAFGILTEWWDRLDRAEMLGFARRQQVLTALQELMERARPRNPRPR